MSRHLLFGALVAVVILVSGGIGKHGFVLATADASCGLEVCPVPNWDAEDPSSTSERSSWHISELMRFTSYEIDSETGQYFESIARLEWGGIRDARFGAIVPVIALFSDSEDMVMGLGNVAAYGQWDRALLRGLRLRLGAQLELPTGTDSSLASNHAEVLSYAGVSLKSGRHQFQAEVGARVGLSTEHSHDMTPADEQSPSLVVNPHGDVEIVYQAIADTEVAQHVRVGGLARGQQLVGDEAETFLSVGGQVSWAPTEAATISTAAELPVFRPARFDMRLSLQASLAF